MKLQANALPLQLWVGVVLIIVFWPLNWLLPGLRTHILFFPLWLGYALTIDGLVYMRTGSSMISRNLRRYILLFFLSAPVWWLFELFNQRTQNWFYIGREYFTDLQYAVLATLAFSTVIPAVFGTAELISTFSWFKKKTAKTPGTSLLPGYPIYIAVGVVLLILLLSLPTYFYGFLWVALFCIIDPINHRLGNRSLILDMVQSNWKPALSLAAGCLICGFFWEFWNIYAYPKWIYNVPLVGFWHIFEMPVLGYLGYIPFAFELFAIYHLVNGVVGRADDSFLHI